MASSANHRRPAVAVVGSIIVDLAVTTPRIPIRGENILGHTFKMGPGGKGANAAAAMARQGARTSLIGAVGTDDLAVIELEALATEGVDISGVLRDPQAHTGIAVIMVDDDGENTILVVMGANSSLTSGQTINAMKPLWERTDAVLVNFEIPPEVVSTVVSQAADHGVTVVVDAGPPRDYGPEIWAQATIISPNLSELETLVGRSLASVSEIQDAAREVLAHGPGAVVLKMGSEGALVVSQEGTQRIPAFPTKVVDTTGAGDAFTGALTVGLAEGLDLSAATWRASAAGALAVTRLGTMPAMPTKAELEEFLGRQVD